MKTLNTLSFLLTMVFILAMQAITFGQGVTTSSISGRVLDQDGEPLIGANIVAVHTPSGSTYGNISNVDIFDRNNLLWKHNMINRNATKVQC